MKQVKRIVALALVALMLLTAGCGTAPASTPAASSSAPAASSAAPADSATPAATPAGPDISKEVSLTWMYHGSTVTDDKAVMEAVNAYLKPLINAKLTMIWCGWGDFDDRVKLAINGGENIDIYFTCSWSADEYSQYAKKGAFVRLDDPNNNLLQKVCPNLFSSLNPVLANGAMTPGPDGTAGIYAIPTLKDSAQLNTWDVNIDMAAKYGYKPEDFKDFYSFGDKFAKIKAGEGANFYPFAPECAVAERAVDNADLVDTNGLLAYPYDPVDPSKSGTAIVSRYETPEYAKFVGKMREYYQAGYISPDMANAQTMNDTRTAAQNASTYAVSTQVYFPGYENMIARPSKVQYVPVQSAIISTTVARGAMQAISSTSQNPDRALMLLNLANTDSKLATMLEYGIEGVHYKLMDDGRIDNTTEPYKTARAAYVPWTAGLLNQTILPVTFPLPTNQIDNFKKFNESGVAVPLLGWAFDPTPVQEKIAALVNVQAEYANALNAGYVDPATALPEFVSKLKANGMDDVVKEANNQVQAWLATQKK